MAETRNQYGMPTCHQLNPLPKRRQLPLDMKNFRANPGKCTDGNGTIRLIATILFVMAAYTIVEP